MTTSVASPSPSAPTLPAPVSPGPTPPTAVARLAAGELISAARRGAVLVDIRDDAARRRHGVLPGGIAVRVDDLVDRLVPGGRGSLAVAVDADVEWVLVSTDGDVAGYLATRLRELGLRRVSAVAGGFHAIEAARMTTAFADTACYREAAAAIAAHRG